MSRQVKVLAALNVAGWLVVVPLLLITLIDPFVKFAEWPRRALSTAAGLPVQLADPGGSPARERPAREQKGDLRSRSNGRAPNVVVAAAGTRPPRAGGVLPQTDTGVESPGARVPATPRRRPASQPPGARRTQPRGVSPQLGTRPPGSAPRPTRTPVPRAGNGSNGKGGGAGSTGNGNWSRPGRPARPPAPTAAPSTPQPNRNDDDDDEDDDDEDDDD